MLNKANLPISAKQIAKMVNNGTITANNPVQRSYVWEKQRKSWLIHSMMEGYPIPAFYARKVDGRVYDFLDGKQRLDAIKGYINNEYFLMGVGEVATTNDDGVTEMVNVDGLYFDNLPEDLQDRIKDYHLLVYYFDGITDDEVRILFRKLNNGKPLSTKEKNIANCEDIATVSLIGEHPLFKKILTEKALEKRNQLPIVMKVWMMMNYDITDVSFESKTFNEVIQNTKMTEDEVNRMTELFDRYLEIYNYASENLDVKVAKVIRKKMASETHLVSLVPFIERSIDEEISVKLMAGFMAEIFGNGKVVSDEYNNAAKSGAAKNVNICIRNDEIDNAWEAYFDEHNNDDEDEDTDDADTTDANNADDVDTSDSDDNVNDETDGVDEDDFIPTPEENTED